jgi:AGZA family xanthine/uracil permease-like MFS transporter
VVSFIESAAGVAAGGRSGVVAVVTGLMFLVSLFIAPLIGAVPSSATAPALVVVGALMISSVAGIDWDDPMVAVPAFLTLITIPLTFSIANGLAFGIVSHVLLKIGRGESRSVPVAAYTLAGLLVVRFIYLGGGI